MDLYSYVRSFSDIRYDNRSYATTHPSKYVYLGQSRVHTVVKIAVTAPTKE